MTIHENDSFEELLRSVKPTESRLESEEEFARTLFAAGQRVEHNRNHDAQRATKLQLKIWQWSTAASIAAVAVGIGLFIWGNQNNTPPEITAIPDHPVTSDRKDGALAENLEPSSLAFRTEQPTNAFGAPSLGTGIPHHDGYQFNRGLFAAAWRNRFKSNGQSFESSSAQPEEMTSIQELRDEFITNDSLQ